MNLQEAKNHILVWLPVMKELEDMGYNPVKMLFEEPLTMEMIEASYIALTKAKKKCPDWYETVSPYINNIMNRVVK